MVGEIQKAYNAYAGILKREADEAYDTVQKLRAGPISMPRDHEWNAFVASSDELVDPEVPVRNLENITYPGKDHPATIEVRSGMLERKSKYLKSYTPGWYVLTPTHLHEFKSTDRSEWQTPVMSLYLPDQKLGSHSQPDSTSHKFMLKGRQTGTMHRGHSWVFRAESHDTMMAWYEDIANLMGRSGETRNAFVRRHYRSASGASVLSNNTNDMEEDEADQTPYSDTAVLGNDPAASAAAATTTEERPQPGGRFPSDVRMDNLRDPVSPSSGASSMQDREFLVGTADTASQAASASAADSGGARQSTEQQSVPSRGSESSSHSNSIMSGSHQERPETVPPLPNESNESAAVRRESASTVPTTTNNTEHTYDTQATSVDEDGTAKSTVESGTQAGDSEKGGERENSVLSTGGLQIPGQYPPRAVS